MLLQYRTPDCTSFLRAEASRANHCTTTANLFLWGKTYMLPTLARIQEQSTKFYFVEARQRCPSIVHWHNHKDFMDVCTCICVCRYMYTHKIRKLGRGSVSSTPFRIHNCIHDCIGPVSRVSAELSHFWSAHYKRRLSHYFIGGCQKLHHHHHLQMLIKILNRDVVMGVKVHSRFKFCHAGPLAIHTVEIVVLILQCYCKFCLDTFSYRVMNDSHKIGIGHHFLDLAFACILFVY